MKHLKTLAMATAAAAAVMAFLGVGAASATVLCTTTSTPCTVPYPEETKFHATLEPGASALFQDTSGSEKKTCTEGTIKGKITKKGGAGATVIIGLEEWTWTNCTHTTVTIAAGELEVHNIVNTDNGTITGRNTKWTTVINGITCTYGFGNGVDIGDLTGGFPATIDIDTVLSRQGGGFLCPETMTLTASFLVTEPKPLFVEAA